MEKKRIVSLTMVLAMTAGLLSGCGEKTQAYVSGNPNMIVIADGEKYLKDNSSQVEKSDTDNIDSYEVAPESKEYAPGEHVFMIRYNFDNKNSTDIERLSISVPEGYEILDIENFDSLGTKIGTTQTYGMDVWYINNEMVVVNPIYNEAFGCYDYSHFGNVVLVNADEELSLSK